MISNHPYQRNGLGGVDENGNVPCGQCGLPPGVHRDQSRIASPARVKSAFTDLLREQEAQLEEELRGVRHKISLVEGWPEKEMAAHGTHN